MFALVCECPFSQFTLHNAIWLMPILFRIRYCHCVCIHRLRVLPHIPWNFIFEHVLFRNEWYPFKYKHQPHIQTALDLLSKWGMVLCCTYLILIEGEHPVCIAWPHAHTRSLWWFNRICHTMHHCSQEWHRLFPFHLWYLIMSDSKCVYWVCECVSACATMLGQGWIISWLNHIYLYDSVIFPMIKNNFQ